MENLSTRRRELRSDLPFLFKVDFSLTSLEDSTDYHHPTMHEPFLVTAK